MVVSDLPFGTEVGVIRHYSTGLERRTLTQSLPVHFHCEQGGVVRHCSREGVTVTSGTIPRI